MNKKIEFEFPYPPYQQQVELMEKIYETIDQSSIGFFER